VELYDLTGQMLAKATRRHAGRPVTVQLSAALDANAPANYYLRYRYDSDEEFRQRSLFFLQEILETTVLGQRELMAGTSASLRVLVSDRAAGEPVNEAAVVVTLSEKEEELARYEGTTNARGELVATFALPDRTVEGAQLAVHVASSTAKDTITETVTVASPTRTLLTTDKPLYQPGQTIHMRSLSLKRPGMTALAGAEVVFEVEDAKGNKVFKKATTADEFGVSHTDFVLARELNKGAYRIRAIVAGDKEEKTVTVDRYVLPKFKIAFKPDRQFYQPGETVKVDLQADYFFGKPVAGAAAHVTCAKFDVAYENFQVIDGATDEQGHYSFEVRLPEHFVGQPLEAGKASAKFEIQLVDSADHKETLVRNVAVTAAPIVIAAVPESGELIEGLENRVYVVTTYADSTPAACKVRWTNAPDGRAVSIQTDEAGFGQIALTPEAGKPLSMTLKATDVQGHTGQSTTELKLKTHSGDDRILLRTDKSLYSVGDKVELDIASTRRKGSVYVDVIKDRQTFLTRTLDLADGKASTAISLDSSLAGTLQINAYLIGGNGVIVRDRRLIIADPANDLRIQIDSDSATYLPGTEAKVSFRVTGKNGRGVAAALGVMVVDEAVFALQEMQPGLEKVYFYLEKEIATPRYEIHGYELAGCLPPMPGPMPREEATRQDSAARVLLASAKGVGDYAIHVNTYQQSNKTQAFHAAMAKAMTARFGKVQQAFAKYIQAHKTDAKKGPKALTLAALVEEEFLKAEEALDPWGNTMRIAGRWCDGCQGYHDFTLSSAGIDGKEGTADDVHFPPRSPSGGGGEWAGRPVKARLLADGAVPLAEAAPRMPAADEEKMEMADDDRAGEGGPAGAGSGAQRPRIRHYFPETLYFNPALITDGRGRAELTIPLADSITTWRLACMASSSAGAMGSTTAGLRVFQDFFVDIDFPVSLTQNDEVSVPVAVYNYLKTEQQVRLVVTNADWFTLKGPAEVTVTLGPSEVKAVYFPIVAKGIGFQTFTVTGFGAKKSDAVARSVEIVPDGKEHLVSHSGRLTADVSHTITVPGGAIDGASTIFVKVYPGMLSQVIEGLDSILRMPGGCFEQTSSTTYPNILVLDYMKTTGKITPELQMKAEGFVNAGYQRLLSFEVAGGGFEWFGNPPAHRILTAYGLMEFHDMSKVFEVDPAVITRTQRWLAACQDSDGSYKPSAGGIAEGAINKFTDDVFRNTAYITWALASTGYKGPEVGKGLTYLRNRLDEMKDTYTLALAANAFATVEPKGETTTALIEALLSKAVEEKDMVYWKAQSETPTHGTGTSADIEVTALAVQAMIKSGREFGTVSKAVTYLAGNKDAYGTWQSTQATIQALRAMLMAERDATAQANATIALAINGKDVKTLTIDESNSDVLQLVDLKELTAKGDNTISLTYQGEGSLLYQIVGRYYLPYPKTIDVPQFDPITIAVDYDRAKLVVDDTITVTATVTNNRPGTAKMVLVDLGLPPGFTLIPDELNRLVDSKAIEKYTTTGRQIIVYLRELAGGKPVTIKYQLLAKYPLKAKTVKSVAYEYYNPDIKGEAEPIEIVVSKE
jgi:uncharacterized protein YfaS (alpha-2-macroglobulin family)